MKDDQQPPVATVAKKLIDFYGGDETKWTQGAFARTRTGVVINPSNPEAACWCLRGAVASLFASSSEGWKNQDALDAVLGDVEAINFNDTHTFSEVIAKLEEIAAGGTDGQS